MAKIFDSMTLRDLTIRNRIWLAPMCQYSAADDGVPTDWHLVHLGARATGGFGLVMAEASAVTPQGRISPNDSGIWSDEQRDAWRPIVEFLQRHGAAAAIQLAHAGRKASTHRGFPGEPAGSIPLDDNGWETIGPSAIAFDGLREPREMTAHDISMVVTAFRAAAHRADEAGFDVVEVHAAHGYLLHEFLSPLSNQRTDGYGGDLDGRSRLLIEVVDAIREVWPAGKPVFVRISGTDWVEGGWDVEQSAQLAETLYSHGVDLVDVSSGGNIAADIPVGPGYQVPLAREIRSTSAGPVTAVGLIVDPKQAEQVLVDGDADAVFLGRAGLREAAWPLRAAAELDVPWRDAPYPLQYARANWDAVPAVEYAV